MSVILSEEDIIQLTGRKQAAAQLRELHQLGFWRARRAPVTGRVILERPHFEAVSRGSTEALPVRTRPKLRPISRDVR